MRTCPCSLFSFCRRRQNAQVAQRIEDAAMSVPASGLFSRWFARPLILAGAVLLALFVAAGFLGSQYWNERRVVDVSLGRSRQVLDTIDRLRTIIANVESERRGYLLTLDPAYLKAYGVSDESVRRETQELQALVANDP